MTTINDHVCHEYHLHQLSMKIVEWEMIAIDLGLNEADTEAIKRNHPNDYKSQRYQNAI